MNSNTNSDSKKQRKIGNIIRYWIIAVITITFFVVLFVISLIQFHTQREFCFEMVEKQVKDVGDDVETAIYEIIEVWTSDFVDGIEVLYENNDSDALNKLLAMSLKVVSEINVVNSDGIIVYSSVPAYVGVDMKASEKTAEFMCLLNGEDYYEQGIRPNVITNENTLYVGKAFSSNKGFVQLGITKDNYDNIFRKSIRKTASKYNIGVNGGVIICDKNHIIIACTEDKHIDEVFDNPNILPANEGERYEDVAKVFGENCYVIADNKGEYYVIGMYPAKEMSSMNYRNIFLNVLTFFVVLLAAISIFSWLFHKFVIKSLGKVNKSLSKITTGDLSEKIEVYNTAEFRELSDGINQTVDRLKEMISEADERVKMELEMARTIQQMSLPQCIDIYRNNSRFRLYACMETAKIVGGDFYDFYMLSQKILVVTMADVSDKGIPAAMFMMRAKTLMKSLAGKGMSVDEMVTQANAALWENNEGNMFVTAWIGFINVDTGLVKYVHAGHTCPVLFGNNESVFIKKDREMLMGSVNDIDYHAQEFTMQSGDNLFLYTDGVTEAEGDEGSFYGNERLLAKLSDEHNLHDENDVDYCMNVCNDVIEDVHVFSGDNPQTDDITVMCVHFL